MLRQETIRRTVKNYLKNLPINVDEAILFGSSTRGDRLIESDIDLIVISSDFKNMDFSQRFLILQKNWKSKTELEAFGFTPEEFAKLKDKSMILQEAVEHGVKLTTSKT
jgi:predicted nucleotidyltransferase